jgi:6-phosphogluconate dehydrogenase
MDIGLVGLGKMGGNMRTRLRNAGHTVIGYDRNPDLADADSLAGMVEKLPSPKVVWVMVPAGDPTRTTIEELGELLGEGDLVVDGGNSKWTDDQLNAEMLAEKGIGFVDCGVSGGVWGLQNGYALMCGGTDDDVAKVQPALDALKPEEGGFVHAGKKPGAGHFAKMVHNGIEYAMMQSYAEGWELLEKVDLVDNVTEVFDSWRSGTVIRSWLLDLLVAAVEEDPHLDKIAGYAEDSGEGRWTVEAAIEHAVPMNVIAASLFARFTSRQDDSPAMKAIAAMRNQFGGHAVHTEPPPGGDAAGPA